MRECVVADFITEIEFALNDIGFLVCRFANDEERSGRVLLLQNIQNLRGPVRIWTIVETERHLMRRGAHLLNAPGKRIALETLVVEGIRARIVFEGSVAALRRR